MKKRLFLCILLFMLFALTGCAGKDDRDRYGNEREDYSEVQNPPTAVEEGPSLAERLVEERLLLPKKEDLVGRWEGYLIYDYANSEWIDLDDSDVDLAFDFYMSGDQLMVKMLDSIAPVEYFADEKSRIFSIAFTMIFETSADLGVEAPPAEMTFSNMLTWKKSEATGEYFLEMLKEGKFRWEWSEGLVVGTWVAERV